MEYKVSQIIDQSQGNLKLIKGKSDEVITDISQITFAATREHLKTISSATKLLITIDIFAHEIQFDKTLVVTTSMQLTMANILPLFDKKAGRHQKGISTKASVHPSAKIASTATICDFAVIEKDAVIGENTIIHSFVYIGALCEVGNNCEIHPHTTIGSDGFGYHQDHNKKNCKIAQIGKVIIEDDVEIGANCTIDRATINVTRIGTGTKIDNLVHIAHNCTVGKNCLLTAGFMMAGSSQIGDNFVTGGGTLVSDHVHIVSNVLLAGRSTVTNDITESGQYGGYPLQPFKDSLKSIMTIAKLPEMRKQLAEVRKKLGLE